MSQSVLARIPLLRVLVPFATGIMAHDLWHSWWPPIVLLAAGIFIYQLIAHLSSSPQGRLRWQGSYIMPLSLMALSLGWLCAIIHCPPRLTDNQCHDRVLAGRITNLDYTDFSTRMTIDLMDNKLPSCKVLLTTRGCNYNLQAGDVVAWKASLNAIGDMGNPYEMDYAAFLLHTQGVRYQQHLPVKQVKTIGHSPTLVTRMASARRYIQHEVFNSSLSETSQQFVIALLLGNGGMIDKATRQEFSAAGVAHVLALSGLHVGLIALFIWWLLFPLDYLGLKKLRLAISLVSILFFAIFTGLSPSVVRAATMIGFVFVSLILYRRSLSLNALVAAALLILVLNPSAIYSVGFQLSFITVGAILLFAQLPASLKSRYQWVNYITSTVITSLVAMVSTVALSAHYFHTISFLSVVSNLLILPVLPIFMALGALFLLVTAAGLQWPILDAAIDGIYSYINWSTHTVNAIPLSHISGVYVSTIGVILYFVVLLLVIAWLYRRNYGYLLAAACSLVVLMSHSWWLDYKTPSRGLIFFNSFSNTPVMYYDHGMGYVWVPDEEEVDSTSFARFHAGFLARHRISGLRFITDDDSLRLADAMINPPHAFLMGRRLLAVGRGKWKKVAPPQRRLVLDDIIVTKRFHGSVNTLQQLYSFDRIILSGATHDATVMLHECDSMHITVHGLSSQGALQYPSEF